jgi:hypothetical protein
MQQPWQGMVMKRRFAVVTEVVGEKVLQLQE